jgi:hypothetical protein
MEFLLREIDGTGSSIVEEPLWSSDTLKYYRDKICQYIQMCHFAKLGSRFLLIINAVVDTLVISVYSGSIGAEAIYESNSLQVIREESDASMQRGKTTQHGRRLYNRIREKAQGELDY